MTSYLSLLLFSSTIAESHSPGQETELPVGSALFLLTLTQPEKKREKDLGIVLLHKISMHHNVSHR